MKEDPEYRRLLERHGPELGTIQPDILTQEQAQEKKHQLQDAIAEVERRERRQQRGAKECQFNKMMLKFVLEQMEVAEVHCPPRITAMAQKMGLRVGWGQDLIICDEH